MDNDLKITLQGQPDHFDVLGRVLAGPDTLADLSKPQQTTQVRALGQSGLAQQSQLGQTAPSPMLRTFGDMRGSSMAPADPVRGLAPQLLGRIPPAAPPSTEIEKPSLLHRVGSVLGKVGEVAGSAVVPNLMQWIPGTEQHKILEEHAREEREQFGTEQGKEKAATEESLARAAHEREETMKGKEIQPGQPGFDQYARWEAEKDALQKANPGMSEADAEYQLTVKHGQEAGIPAEKTVESGGQAYEYNPKSGKYDVPIGTPKPAKEQTPEEQAISLQQVIDSPTSTPEQKAEAQRNIAALQKGVAAFRPPVTPKGEDEQAISDRLAARNLPDNPQNRDSVRMQIRKELAEANRPPKDTGARDTARADASYKYNSGVLDKMQNPIDQISGRFGRLEDTLAQKSPQADALVAPELLSIMAGGQGSGIRMNEAEIARIVGGRSQWESLKAAMQKWNTDPNAARSITPDQDKQIRDLINTVGQKLAAKRQVLDEARNSLLDTDDVKEQRRITADARGKLDAIDSGEHKERAAGEGKAPQGATSEVLVGGKVVGHVVNGKYVAMGK